MKKGKIRILGTISGSNQPWFEHLQRDLAQVELGYHHFIITVDELWFVIQGSQD